MTSRLKIFIIAFLISLPFFVGINYAEKELSDFLFWRELALNPQIFKAEISLEQKWHSMKPIRDSRAEDLEINASGAISILVDGNGKERILFEKNSREKLPIASLTKLMTAWVVLDYYNLENKITISEKAASHFGDRRGLPQGRTFTVEYLLYPLLMESNNGVAFALANDYSGMSQENFVEIMNKVALENGLTNTYFSNPSGLDPDNADTINYSTAYDLAKLTEKLLEKPLVWQILSLPKYSEYGPELNNTNLFLINNNTDWHEKIIGGKTGYTRQAGGCLMLVLKMPRGQGYLINVILGTEERDLRFDEMKNLIDWLKTAYKW